MRKEVGGRGKDQNLVNVFVFMLFSDNPIISVIAVPRDVLEAKSKAEWRKKSVSYQKNRQEFIRSELAMALKECPDLKDLSTSEKEKHAKKFEGFLGMMYDLQCDALNKTVIGNWA